jgi:SAM-dependent methyltransferase
MIDAIFHTKGAGSIALNLRNYARQLRRAASRGKSLLTSRSNSSKVYARRVQAETKFFSECQDPNALPIIYQYWSNKFLRPKLEQFGFMHPEALFCQYLSDSYVASKRAHRIFLSVGSGFCDTEVRLAEDLIGRGNRDFTIECLELNAGLLEQGQTLAADKGVGAHIVALRGDFNKWTPTKTYDAVLANSSLHHVLNLEGLLEGIKSSLAPTGFFVTCDTIGRNGHMRWPEALSIVNEYWRELPREYTYNHLLKRHESVYDNWDCSVDGFEGIRAQDILPLLIDNFHFNFFVPFGNVIDPFIDRAFGHNFKIENPWDIDFIDRVHLRDEGEMIRGAIKPTHIVAAMSTARPARVLMEERFTPAFCVRRPSRPPVAHRELPDLTIAPAPAKRDTDLAGPDATVAKQPFRPLIDYTDLWWQPKESGWGLSIHQHASGGLFAIWLTFGPQNDPIWYTLQPGAWTGSSTFSGPIFATSGPPMNGPFSESSVQRKQVGTGTLDFTDQANGTLSYELQDVVGTKSITRMIY